LALTVSSYAGSVAGGPTGDDVMARARAWRNAAHAAVCDVIEPWEHGTVARATRYPSYYDFNVVRVEDDPGMSVDALAAFADEALAGLEHRRVDFDLVAAGEPLRAAFAASGWQTVRLVWMRHEAPAPPGPTIAVEQVPYDAVHELRVAWHGQDFPDLHAGGYHAQAREVALRREAQVLAVFESGAPVAFAQLERVDDAAEITQVYVHPDHRGRQRGTAMTRAAIAAAGDVRDLWIVADDEDRPKDLYARLGFRPAWTSTEFTRLPRGGAGS
jgi:ribosomal protein S18 acetylase RimI-like enzyme